MGAALRGTWFVAPTAFADDGSLDVGSQRRLVEAAIAWGVDGVTAMGVTSEPATLSTDEREAALVLERVVRVLGRREIRQMKHCVVGAAFEAVAGRVPIVVGCSGLNVEAVVDLIGQARALGAAAAMVSAPPGFGDLDALPAFFAAVARDGGLPLVLQDEPVATGVVLPVGVILACLEAAGARAVKLEDPPTPPKIAALLAADPGLSVFGGLGGSAALGELRNGARGTMTGFAFPEILRAVREAVEANDLVRAEAVFERHLPLIQFEAQPRIGLGIRKELLRRRGALAYARTRIGEPLSPETLGELDEVLSRVEIRPSPNPLQVE